MPIKFDSINLFIDNMKRTLSFYSLLGFEFSKEDYSKNYVKIDFGSCSLCFYSTNIVKDFFKDERISTNKNHQYELSFRVDSANDVDTLYNKMISNGYHSVKEPENTEWKQRTAFITDPDNNLIEICAFL